MSRKGTGGSTHDSKTPVFNIEKASNDHVDDLEDQKDENSATTGRWTIEEHRKFIQGIIWVTIP